MKVKCHSLSRIAQDNACISLLACHSVIIYVFRGTLSVEIVLKNAVLTCIIIC